jgi:outer membrane lipoprotein-sorting protein
MTRTFSLFTHLVLIAGIANAYPALTLPIAIVAKADAAEKPKGTPIPFAKPAEALPEAVQTNATAVGDASKSELRGVNKKDLAGLKALNEKYRKAKSITMNVAKDVKLGLIGSQRHSVGKLQLASGQIRMELEGSEHTMLIVNKKNVFAITYPDKSLQGAAIQVIKGDVASKKAKKQAQSSALSNLLGPGGFLKSFNPTGVETKDGVQTFFLSPIGDSDMTRAQLKVSNGEIRELHYWDARDNETIFQFSNTKFGEKIDPKIFNYTPPANADVMNL